MFCQSIKMNQGNLLSEIIKARESIKRKHLALKLGKEAAENLIKERLKPVISPLERLVGNFQNRAMQSENTTYHEPSEIKPNLQPSFKNEKNTQAFTDNKFQTGIDGGLSADTEYKDNENINEEDDSEVDKIVLNDFEHEDENNATKPTGMQTSTPLPKAHESRISNVIEIELPQKIQEYTSMFSTRGKRKNLDEKLGIRKLSNGYFIGNAPVDLKDNGDIIIGGREYQSTEGLLELLFKKNPIDELVTEADIIHYRSIVLNTNADKKYFKANELIREDPTGKLEKYVKRSVAGEGYMVTNSSPINYMYWNDPNELIDRLRLLDSAVQAGNMSHINEIESIIEELREAKIIY